MSLTVDFRKTYETLPRYSFTAFFNIVRFFVFSLKDFLTVQENACCQKGMESRRRQTHRHRSDQEAAKECPSESQLLARDWLFHCSR